MKSKKGFSLIELLITIGIIAAISILAFVIYKSTTDSLDKKEMSDNLIDIRLAYNEAIFENPEVKSTSFNGLSEQFNGQSFFQAISPFLNAKNQSKVAKSDGFSFPLNKHYSVTYSDLNFGGGNYYSPGLLFMSTSQADQSELISNCINTAQVLTSIYDSVQVSGYNFIRNEGKVDMGKISAGCEANPDYLQAGFIVAPSSSQFGF